MENIKCLEPEELLEELLALKQWNYEEHIKKYEASYVHVGDYTYGIPHIDYYDSEVDNGQLYIGKFCAIAANVTISLGGNHSMNWGTIYPFHAMLPSKREFTNYSASKGDVRIGNDVWIGDGVKILSGVTIGDGAVLGANALITKDVEAYSVVGGNPAKRIRYRFSEETRHMFLEMKWWDWPDHVLAVALPLLLSENHDELYALYQGLKEDKVLQ
ncbi:MAG: CatB-related O-acetyltransferase [Lachnospiraceae bacterium]|nr:CatB-related O-acetyltransferase [Lachnospiraceae bacterium]